MKLATRSILLAFLFLTASCETMKESGIAMPDLNAMLAGITDQQTAEQAKAPLDGAIGQLQSALNGVTKKVESGAVDADGKVADGQSMIKGVLSQFGITGETTGMIGNLMSNPAIKSVLGGSLQQLMGLIPGM